MDIGNDERYALFVLAAAQNEFFCFFLLHYLKNKLKYVIIKKQI